jgi:hypothetical protein
MIFEAADRGRREKETGASRFFCFTPRPVTGPVATFTLIQALSNSGV